MSGALHKASICRWKRGLDMFVAAGLLLVLAPVILLACAGVLLTMGLPVIFEQERPGLGGRPFRMYKIRSMRVPMTGELALPDRDRLTPLGRILRATSIDELPSLWNILRGEMSLVGPRPLLKRYLPFFTTEERVRFLVRPGLTGLAQIRGRNSRAWDLRLADDVEYLKRWTLLLDLQILCRTLIATVRRQGVRIDPSSAMQDLDRERRGGVTVECLSVDDSDEIAMILKSSYDPLLFDCSVVFCRGFSRLLREQMQMGDFVLGLRHFGRLAGVLQLRIVAGHWHINHFAIASTDRGWGLGPLLLADLVKRAGVGNLSLHVDGRNSRAMAFYAEAGFLMKSSVDFVLVRLGDTPVSESPSNPPMSEESLAELSRAGFCKIDVTGSARRGLYLEGRRVALDEGHSMATAEKILAWLGYGLVKLPAPIAPPGVRVLHRWQVHFLTRTNRSQSEQLASNFLRKENGTVGLGGE